MNFEILESGKIDTIIQTLGEYLTNLSNRDYSKFNNKGRAAHVRDMIYTLDDTRLKNKTKKSFWLSSL